MHTHVHIYIHTHYHAYWNINIRNIVLEKQLGIKRPISLCDSPPWFVARRQVFCGHLEPQSAALCTQLFVLLTNRDWLAAYILDLLHSWLLLTSLQWIPLIFPSSDKLSGRGEGEGSEERRETKSNFHSVNAWWILCACVGGWPWCVCVYEWALSACVCELCPCLCLPSAYTHMKKSVLWKVKDRKDSWDQV